MAAKTGKSLTKNQQKPLKEAEQFLKNALQSVKQAQVSNLREAAIKTGQNIQKADQAISNCVSRVQGDDRERLEIAQQNIQRAQQQLQQISTAKDIQ